MGSILGRSSRIALRATMPFSILYQDGGRGSDARARGHAELSSAACSWTATASFSMFCKWMARPGTFTPRRLRAAMQRLSEQVDVRALEIRGFIRTTGARPGRLPPPLVFRRR